MTRVPKELEQVSNGILINMKSNEIVCFPPQAPLQLSNEMYQQYSILKDLKVQQIMDGIDVFLYYFNDSWRIITPCTT